MGDSSPIFPPSLNDLNFPMNPFNVMTLVSPAPRTDEQPHPTQEDDPEMFGIPDVSMPSIGVCVVDEWQTSLTWVHLNGMNHQEDFSSPALLQPGHHYANKKKKNEPGRSFRKKERVLHHFHETSGQPLPEEKTTRDSQWNFNLRWISNFDTHLKLPYIHTDTYLIRITLLDWCRVGLNHSGTNACSQSFLPRKVLSLKQRSYTITKCNSAFSVQMNWLIAISAG